MVPLGGKCQRRAINTQFHAIDRLRCVAKLCHIHLIFASMRLIFNTGSFSTCRPDLIAWQEECVRYSWDIFTMGQQESESKKDTHTHTRRVCHIQSQIFCIILVRCQAPAVLLGLMRKMLLNFTSKQLIHFSAMIVHKFIIASFNSNPVHIKPRCSP